ncbi:MAG: WG repeat-containing protein [Bacteroidetes bacterium]|nr:WG repeat-containing protein [Bacteroidota bacterium]
MVDGDLVYPFFEGRAAVRKNGKYGFIDKKGIWVISPQYDYASWYSEGLALVAKAQRCGYIDRNGTTRISFQYLSAEDFIGGLAYVILTDNTKGYIDTDGNLVWHGPAKKGALSSEVFTDEQRLNRRLRQE